MKLLWHNTRSYKNIHINGHFKPKCSLAIHAFPSSRIFLMNFYVVFPLIYTIHKRMISSFSFKHTQIINFLCFFCSERKIRTLVENFVFCARIFSNKMKQNNSELELLCLQIILIIWHLSLFFFSFTKIAQISFRRIVFFVLCLNEYLM